jgi:hypothetical protein
VPYTRRTTTREEFIVDAPPPAGAPISELSAAWAEADKAYRDARELAAEGALPEGALTVRPAPNAVVISFVTEHPPT